MIFFIDELLPKQNKAIKNAKRLMKKYSNSTPPADKNPSTTVFELVEELNTYVK